MSIFTSTSTSTSTFKPNYVCTHVCPHHRPQGGGRIPWRGGEGGTSEAWLIYIYIYMYKCRFRERERETDSFMFGPRHSRSLVPLDIEKSCLKDQDSVETWPSVLPEFVAASDPVGPISA